MAARRRVLAARWLGVAAAACVVACHGAPPSPILRTINGQNVLLVTIDTLRADALGSYGGRSATPALDRLAAEGVRFESAHAHAVVTLASHASILTGQYPYIHGIRDNSGFRLRAETPTIATMLKDARYATGAFVGAFPLNARFGLNRGFDVYDDRVGDSRVPTEFGMPERPATAVVALARAWIGAHRAERWFAWVHLFDPHAPYRPPPPFDKAYAERPYDGEVAATDAALAPLLDDVRAAGRPALVVVTADHGEGLGEHGEQTHGVFAYESTLRVPLIIAELGQNGSTARSETASAPVRHVDLLPTMLDAAGFSVPHDVPGRSLISADARRDVAGAPASYFEAMGPNLNDGWAPLAGVLVGRDKYIDLPMPERYDLAADPHETRNLAGQDPSRDRALASRLRELGASASTTRVTEDPAAEAALRALGYVSGRAAPKARYVDADDPKSLIGIDQSVHRAVDAVAAGRPQEAEGIYEEIIQRRPDMALAYRHLAFLKARRGDLAGATTVLQRATRQGAADRRVLAQLAEYLIDRGQTRQAIELLEPLVEAGPIESDALNTLGIAYAQSGRTADARRIFERGVAEDPTSSVPLENLGMLALGQRDLDAARLRFEEALRVDPKSSRAYSGLGAVASRAGNRDAAIASWSRAVELDGRNLDALYNLGVALVREKRVIEARPYLEQYLRTAPASLEKERREIAALLPR
ncbi:MAG TPA: sulfatase-like hydrolase/transferase [Vicinamibacterales bacterium]|jgi:arylsulfatase A-like enzyme/Tfp pilus assembly protein PilF